MKTAQLVSKGQAFLRQVQSNLLPRNQKADIVAVGCFAHDEKRLVLLEPVVQFLSYLLCVKRFSIYSFQSQLHKTVFYKIKSTNFLFFLTYFNS